MKIYLASNYSTFPEMQKHAATLTGEGHEVTSEWISGAHQADDHADYAAIDLRNIDEAEAVILWSESPNGSRTRGGKHVEFGYALAAGKRLFIVGPCGNVFHHLPQVVQRHSLEDLLPILRGLGNRTSWLPKETWISWYGGQGLLDAEGFTVVPCDPATCGDSICHGWRVALTPSEER